MIFGVIKSDDKVFTGDKLRIDVSQTFLAPSLVFATVSHEISMDAGVTWFDVSQKKQLEWIFSTSGTKTIQLRVSTTEPSNQIFTKTVSVLDLTAQNLFSKDFDLYVHEPEIDKYLPKKWSSWNLVHLQAQQWIMDLLDENGYKNQKGEKYKVEDLMDKQQVKQLSVYKTLEFIFEGNSNVAGDIYSLKRDKYRELANEKSSRSNLALDYNDNATQDAGEETNLFSVDLKRG